MTSLSDDLVLAQTILAVQYPALSFTPGGRAYSYAEAVLARVNDARHLVEQSTPQTTIPTAQGPYLDALGANVGGTRFGGSAAAVPVLFYVPQAATETQTIDAGTIVSTSGTVSTQPAIGFATTEAAVISAGQILAGATIGAVVPISGTSVSAGLSVSPSVVQIPPTLVAATWTFTAVTGGYTLAVTPLGSPTVSVPGPGGGPFVTGLAYDDPAYIPGVQFYITGTLTSGHSASVTTGGATVLATQNGPIDPVTGWIYGNAGNVAAGAISQVVASPLPGLQVTNPAAVDGTHGSTLGFDPWSDATYRASLNALLFPEGTAQDATAAMLAVPTVYAALIVDPHDGSGHYTYYWSDINGATPGLTFPGGTPTIAAGSTAALVDAAVRGAQPGGLTPTPAHFNIISIGASGIAAHYHANTAVQSSTIEPQIAAALCAYVQALQPGQTPTYYGMITALDGANIQLTNFVLTSSYATAGATDLYRAVGDPATIVSLTRDP